jgi:TrmH family RNA methyltransferase
VIRLRDKSSERRERGLFIAEGRRIVEEIPEELIETLFVAESFQRESWRGASLALPFVEEVSDAVMAKMADTVSPQGILAVVRQQHPTLDEMAKGGLILLLDRIQDPGNLGTMIRTAEACGADGILCDAGTADRYSPKVVRSTMGSLFHLPIIGGLQPEEVISFAEGRGCQLLATALDESARPLYERKLAGPTVLVFGNEGNGVSPELLNAGEKTYIPMVGGAESLNVGVSAAVALFEALRQRKYS